jgi:hypothetical protein
MLDQKKAEQELQKVKDGNWHKVCVKRIGSLKGRSRKTVRKLTGAYSSKTILSEILSQLNSTVLPDITWSLHNSNIPEAAEEFDAMSSNERLRAFEALFPSMAMDVEYCWQMQKQMPYQRGFVKRAFRAPHMPQASRITRANWLKDLAWVTQGYDKDVCWFAEWAPYLSYYSTSDCLGLLFAGAIDRGGKKGQEVYDILVASGNGEHEIGAMGRHVTRGLMSCSREDGWEFIEKMLLAAQRQEGLRQTILESIDLSHPVAFRRMLKLILDENMMRFSSVVRAADVWFSLRWDSASAGAIREIIKKALLFLDDETVRRNALLDTDIESVYMSLWATAFEDAFKAIPLAAGLMSHKDVAHRFTGIWLLQQTGLFAGIETGLFALDDKDIRVSAIALSMLSDGEYARITNDNIFGRLEKVFPRFPSKRQKQKPLLWPWLELKLSRADVADAMIRNLGDLSIDRIIPYVRSMSSGSRYSLVSELSKRKKWTVDARRLLLSLIGDTSSFVRESVLKSINKIKITEDEAPGMEKLLCRKPGDIRRGVLEILLRQSNGAVIVSAKRLLESSYVLQRQAGLELLRQMKDGKRAVNKCVKLAEEYQQRTPKLSSGEETILKALLGGKIKTATLENALGLCDLSKRTRIKGLKKHYIIVSTPAVQACIKSLDDLIHKHREHVVPKRYYGSGKGLLGNEGFEYPEPDVALQDDLANLPLAEIWQQWYSSRPINMRDTDGLELVRIYGHVTLSEPYRYKRWWKKTVKTLFGDYYTEKVRYRRHLSALSLWLVKMFPNKHEVDFLLVAAETALSRIGQKADSRCLYECGSPYLHWLSNAEEHRKYFPQRWTSEQTGRLWRLLKWCDEPSVRLKQKPVTREWESALDILDSVGRRNRPDFALLSEAYDCGYANVSDVYDHLLGPRNKLPVYYGYYSSNFHSLSMLTRRKWPQKVKQTEKLTEIVEQCCARILEIELCRGDTPTEATEPALSIKYLRGIDNFIGFVKALDKCTLTRGWRRDSKSKEASFSHLIRISFPSSSETPEEFARETQKAGITQKRLLELAVYAPQWARMVEQALRWQGLEEAVWWIHAHTKDQQWLVPDEIREIWAAEVTERTPLSAEDLLEGAVDIEWFIRAYKKLKKSRWDKLYACAKFASGGGGHRRAQLFSEAMLKIVKKSDLVKRINEKRHQDAVRALGLLPLASGKSREKDLLQRYKLMQEFIRTSRQFGSQRQASEKRAATIGQENLARTAGYPDPIRLQWAMEAHAIADLADGPIEISVDDMKVTLIIDEFGEVKLSANKKGKILKTLPAKTKKDRKVRELRKRKTELKRQISRIRNSLEQMMCRGQMFSGDEVSELMRHPLIAPMLSRLVLIGAGIIGYPREKGKLLENCEGKKKPIRKDERLRIAHPHDLLVSGWWHQWQRECFEAERVQPFKQVFRELYVLTENEKTENKVSRRYAGHQVNPRQALALLGSRGWINKPEEGIRRTFHDQDLSAWVEFQECFYTPAEIEGLTLEGIHFSKKGKWESIALDKIPPLIFSEVMRDIDLVVSVAHRGGVDPEASASTIEMRTDLLRETLAVLSVENVRIENIHALVKGRLGQYSVHLGSAVTHIMPGGSLMLVPVHSQHRGRLFLPFADDDPKTAEVLSIVLLLARDEQIKDPNILDQIRFLSRG